MSNPELDRVRVSALAAQIFEVVRAHMDDPKPSPLVVFEVLNALGLVAGSALAGTGADLMARNFFDEAVEGAMEDCLEKRDQFIPGGNA